VINIGDLQPVRIEKMHLGDPTGTGRDHSESTS
jgi:hypothetical protein